MIDDRIKNGVIKHYEQGLDLVSIAQKMNTKKDVVIEILVADLYSKGNSYNDIMSDLEIKKSVVEGILGGIKKNAETPTDTYTRSFQTPTADTLTKQKASDEVEKLNLQLAILEKNKAIEEIRLKQIQEVENTTRMKNNAENSLNVRKFEAEQKRQQVADFAQIKSQSSAKEKKEIAALQKKINDFISQHLEELDEDLEVYIEKSACDKYLKVVKKLQSSYSNLFAGIDISETLHGIALDCLIEDLTCADDEDGNSLSYSDVEIFEDCLADGVELGDTEVAEQEEDD